MQERYEKLVERLGEVQDIAGSAGILAWDQRTMMPEAGARARADQLSTLVRLAFERFTADEIGGLLDELEDWGESLDYESTEAALLRVTRRDYDKATRVPIDLPRRDGPRRSARRAGLARGAADVRLRAFPAPPRAGRRTEEAVHRVLPARRRALRRTPRRLRAGDEDRRGPRSLRRAQEGPRPARRRDRPARGRRRRRDAHRRLPARAAARARRRGAERVRLPGRGVACRRDAPPVRLAGWARTTSGSPLTTAAKT